MNSIDIGLYNPIRYTIPITINSEIAGIIERLVGIDSILQ